MSNLKYSLIIGASKGIGRAVAITLAKEGYINILVARNEEGLNETKKQCDEYTESHVIAFDITKDQGELVSKIKQITSEINFVWLGAGAEHVETIDNLDMDKIEQIIRVGFEGQLKLIKNLLDELKEGKAKIVTASSDVWWGKDFNYFGPAVFQATKYALMSLGNLLNNELKKDGIHLTNLRMGNAGSLENYELSDAEKQISETDHTMITLADICDSIKFILSIKHSVIKDITIVPADPEYF